MIKLMGLIGLAVAASFASAAPEPSYTLVKDGKPTSVIVIPRQPASGVAAWGAKELQDHVKKITGADVPVVYDDDKVDAGLVRISIGDTVLSRAAGLDMNKLAEQEYQLQFEPGVILLMGRDLCPNPWPMEVQGRYKSAEGVFGLGHGVGGRIMWSSHAFPDGKGSIELWMRDDVQGNIWKIGGQDNESQDNVQTLYLDETRDFTLGYKTVANGKKVVLQGPKLSKGWHLVTTTWDAEVGKKQILVDGKIVAEGPYEKTDCGKMKNFTINELWAGAIDEFRMSRKIVRSYPNGVEKKPFEKDEFTKLLLHFDLKDGVTYDGEKPWAALPEAKQPGYGVEVGTTYAVYDFLEKYCGVRWYFATELGTVTPKTTTLTISNAKNEKRRPAILYRSSTGLAFGDSPMVSILQNRPSQDDAGLYQTRLRMSVWAPLNVSHSFYGYYDRFWAKNPSNEAAFVEEHKEWFAKNPDGTPRGNPPNQMCYTDPGFISNVIKEAKLRYSYGDRVFGVVPMDNMDHCQCSNCAALQIPPEKRNKGYGFMNNYASELVWSFVKKVADGVAKDCPGFLIGELSYADYSVAPKTVTLPDNVCAGPCWAPNLYPSLIPDRPESEPAQYYEWVAMKKKTGMLLNCWIYQCFPDQYGAMKGFNSWPGFHADRIPIYLRQMAKDKIDSIYFCGVTPGIDTYLTCRLMDDPTLDVKTMLNEFFPLYYGKAGAPMQKLYNAIEQSYLIQGGGSLLESYDRYQIREILRDGKSWIKEARELAETDEQKKRVATFEEGTWNHILKGWDQFVAHWGGKPLYPFCYKDDQKPFDRVEGKFGNALKLGPQVSVWDHGFSDKAGTVEFWLMAVTTGGVNTGGNIYHVESPGAATGHHIQRDSFTDADGTKHYDQYVFQTWVGGKTNEVKTGLIGAGWHHLMARWDAASGKMDVIVDGKVKKSGRYVATQCANAYRVEIGGTAYGPLDEFRLSSAIRKPALQMAPYTSDAKTLLLLHFDEEQGQYPTESSGRDWNAVSQ